MLNALIYMAQSGCAWRMLPHDLTPWQAVDAFWRRLVEKGSLIAISDALRLEIRLQEEREPEPSLVIVDSQSAQTAE
jgi:putative transposase